MIWFADTSALVKRYINETGSAWFRSEVVRHRVLISQLTPIELAAALSKRLRDGSISRFAYYQARKRVLLHLAEDRYSVLELSQRTVTEALRLTFSQALRAYDAVQLGTALVAMAGGDRSNYVFVTADEKLETLAMAQGLQTDNPSRH